ncbi:MAG: ABC transporter permease subunit [Clostridia bacterium]|nr:ABC transporter permease subunit [Clostridia bacterium]
MKKGRLLNLILPLITALCIIGFWAIAAAVISNEYILPTVTETLSSTIALFSRAEFYLAFCFTLLRSVIAFIVSFLLAFVLAFLSEKVKHAEKVINPIISVIRALPTVAVMLLLLFWTNSLIAPIIVTTLVVMPTTYTQIKSALSALDKSVVEAARVDGADEKAVFLDIEFPLISPSIYSAVGSGISLNFKLMVAAEVLSQTANSIGYLLNTSKVYFEIAEMLALVLTAVIFGIIVESVFNKLSKSASEKQ